MSVYGNAGLAVISLWLLVCLWYAHASRSGYARALIAWVLFLVVGVAAAGLLTFADCIDGLGPCHYPAKESLMAFADSWGKAVLASQFMLLPLALGYFVLSHAGTGDPTGDLSPHR